MSRRRQPIGIQSFRRLRETNICYAEKTPLIRQLAEQCDHRFLSRPRRFGKSLLLDTGKCRPASMTNHPLPISCFFSYEAQRRLERQAAGRE